MQITINFPDDIGRQIRQLPDKRKKSEVSGYPATDEQFFILNSGNRRPSRRSPPGCRNQRRGKSRI